MCMDINDCAVHFRNDREELDSVDPYLITYVGEWAVYTELNADDTPLTEEQAELTDAMIMAASFGLDNTAYELANKLLGVVSRHAVSKVYNVGLGAISDVMDTTPPETFKAPDGFDQTVAHHLDVVFQVRNRKS